MGKKHCRSKQEVLQRMQEKKREEAGSQEPVLKNRLRTINQVRPAIEKAREQIREGK